MDHCNMRVYAGMIILMSLAKYDLLVVRYKNDSYLYKILV
jgi:hypothetical protein